MRIRHALALVLAGSLWAQDPPRPHIPSHCERQLLNTGHKVPVDAPGLTGDTALVTSQWQHALFADLLSDFSKTAPPGTVLYSFMDVTQTANRRSGVAAVRLERGPMDTQVTLLNAPTLPPRELSQRLELAIQPSAIQHRRDLAAALLGPADLDADKVVLLRELDHYGVLPSSLNRSSSVLLASNDVGRGLSNYALLKQPVASTARKSRAVVAFPETETEMDLVFGTKKESHIGAPKEWASSLALVRTALAQQGISALSIADMVRLGTKAKLEESLQDADDIVVLLAHVDGCSLQLGLPGPEGINLQPKDIALMRLPKKPFIILRACYGHENGFSEALLKAGARGVWINRGTTSPSESTRDVEMFFESLGRTKNILDTIHELSGESSKLELPGARRTVRNAGVMVFTLPSSVRFGAGRYA